MAGARLPIHGVDPHACHQGAHALAPDRMPLSTPMKMLPDSSAISFVRLSICISRVTALYRFRAPCPSFTRSSSSSHICTILSASMTKSPGVNLNPVSFGTTVSRTPSRSDTINGIPDDVISRVETGNESQPVVAKQPTWQHGIILKRSCR